MEDILHKLYYDAETGFQGLDKLYRKAKQLDKKITKKLVKEWLERQATQQITTEQKKSKKIYSTIISPSVKNNFQMDVMYLPNPTTNRFPYLLTCIDVYSRKAFVNPMRNKNADTALTSFKEIAKSSSFPKNINLDLGGEFDNRLFKDFCESRQIKLWFSDPNQDNKNSIVERFHRTLRGILLKYEVARKRPYINDIQKLVANYNNTFHKTIKATPNQVWNGDEPNKQEVKYIVYDFGIGDSVRHAVQRAAFGKASSTVKYTKEVYTISRIVGSAYYLTNKQGKELNKPFRGHELTKAVGEDAHSLYDTENKTNEKKQKVEKVLRRELGVTKPPPTPPVPPHVPPQPLKYVREPTIDFFAKYK